MKLFPISKTDSRPADTNVNRTTIRLELRSLRDSLAEIAASLDTIDHDAARRLHVARDAIFDACKILRAESDSHGA